MSRTSIVSLTSSFSDLGMTSSTNVGYQDNLVSLRQQVSWSSSILLSANRAGEISVKDSTGIILYVLGSVLVLSTASIALIGSLTVSVGRSSPKGLYNGCVITCI
jgi:hypothetical protein